MMANRSLACSVIGPLCGQPYLEELEKEQTDVNMLEHLNGYSKSPESSFCQAYRPVRKLAADHKVISLAADLTMRRLNVRPAYAVRNIA